MPRVLKYNNKNKIRGRAMRNLPLLDMYKAAIGWIMPDYNNDDNRIILQMTDSSGLVYDPSKSSKEDWEKDNLYTCDILLPGSKADSSGKA